jgi:hypothetical protein
MTSQPKPDSPGDLPKDDSQLTPANAEFYCPRCAQPVIDPLMCGDCASLICRRCGAPLERIDELGIG